MERFFSRYYQLPKQFKMIKSFGINQLLRSALCFFLELRTIPAPAKRHDGTGGRTFSWILLGCLGCCPTDPSITSFVPPPSGSAYFNVAGISCWIHFWNCYDYKELNQDAKLIDWCHQFRIHTSSVHNIWLAVSSCFFWFTNSQWTSHQTSVTRLFSPMPGGSWTCNTSHLSTESLDEPWKPI